jgi:hypothetical protein
MSGQIMRRLFNHVPLLIAALLLGAAALRPTVGRDGTARLGAAGAPAAATAPAALRFTTVDIYVDSQGAALAAYQIALTPRTDDVKLLGVEGGEQAAFSGAPYYDPRALTLNRIIVAAYSVAGDLPRGRTRVARLHVSVNGAHAPQFDSKLVVAADADGKEIGGATVVVSEGAHP